MRGSWAVAVLLGISIGCGGAPEHDERFATGPLMLPGEDCTRCHQVDSEYPSAPIWSVAGTVFSAADAAADDGVAGVDVRLLDASGTVLETLRSNAAGNFYTARVLPPDYRVELSYLGERIAMPCPPPSGGCAKCHDDPPIGAAPGRIYIPQAAPAANPGFDCETWMRIGR